MSTAYEQIVESFKHGTGEASKLSGQAKEMVLGYLEEIRKNETVKSFEQYSAEYIAKAQANGKMVADDVTTSAKDFLTTTETGKTISSWANKTWTAISEGAQTAANHAKDGATYLDNQSGNLLSKNQFGLIAAIIAFIGGTFATGNPLVGLALGTIGGAALGYLADKDSSLKTAFRTEPTVTVSTPTQPAASEHSPQQSQTTDAPNHVQDGTTVSPKAGTPTKPAEASKQAVPTH